MIWRLLVERRQLTLTEEQERVAQTTFDDLSRDELLTLLTRVIYASPGRLRSIRQTCRAKLTSEEQVLRDIAFSRLSRKEILNLLTRRLWGTIKRANPVHWRRRPRTDAPGPPEETGTGATG